MRKISCGPRARSLREVLLAEGRKQNWLAAETGITEARISRIVNGLARPSADDQRRIAEALDRSVSELFPDEVAA